MRISGEWNPNISIIVTFNVSRVIEMLSLRTIAIEGTLNLILEDLAFERGICFKMNLEEALRRKDLLG